MSYFFIKRPIFAWVIALVIMGVGALSILRHGALLQPVLQHAQAADVRETFGRGVVFQQPALADDLPLLVEDEPHRNARDRRLQRQRGTLEGAAAAFAPHAASPPAEPIGPTFSR